MRPPLPFLPAPAGRNGPPRRRWRRPPGSGGDPLADGGTRRPWRPGHRLGLVAAVGLVVSGLWVAGPGPAQRPALAEVQHGVGFEATVLGWTSWYGSYGLGELGWGWCIDHGRHAPDPAFGYVPVSIDGETDGDTQAAMAWAAATHPPTDAVEAAAVMLVQHDLRRASYPFGILDVDGLSPANLAGFGGQEGEVLGRARAIKAEALAHAHLRGPYVLTITAEPVAPGASGRLWAVVTDAQATPVGGLPITVSASGATLTSGATLESDTGGVAVFSYVAGPGDDLFGAVATGPDLHPAVFGSTTVYAQRLIRPGTLEARAATGFTAPVPTTTTAPPPPTTVPPTTTSTTTTSTTTTSTTAPTTTTTRPPTTTTSTTRPPTTTAPTTTTTVPVTTTTTTPPPSSTSTTSTTSTTTPGTSTTSAPTTSTTTSPPAPPPTAGTPSLPPVPAGPPGRLPVTGGSSAGLALVGSGLVVLGVATRGAVGGATGGTVAVGGAGAAGAGRPTRRRGGRRRANLSPHGDRPASGRRRTMARRRRAGER